MTTQTETATIETDVNTETTATVLHDDVKSTEAVDSKESNLESKSSEKPEEVASETTKEEAKKEEEVKEIDYKLKLGKESVLDNSAVDSVVEFAKENNLSNEQAQIMLKSHEDLISNFVEQANQKENEMIEGWKQEVIDDKILGGDNFKQTVLRTQSVVEKFGSDEFKEALTETGYGNHPALIQFLNKIGKAMEPDTLINTNVRGASRPVEDLFYSN